jgi:putative SOS response-associated peptidase YedK
MCNRFRSISEWSQIPRQLYTGPRVNFEFNPNVAPTETVPALIAGDGVVVARFGINKVGAGGKPRPPLLNARTDGMRKGQFRSHLKSRRCVIPADGFYEWRDEGGKQPYYFSRKDGKPLMLAGIWEEAEYKGDKRTAFAILTEEPNELVASYHDRMPLALADDKVALWLDLSQESPLDENLLLDLGVLGHAEHFEPVRNLLHRGHQADFSLPALLDRQHAESILLAARLKGPFWPAYPAFLARRRP